MESLGTKRIQPVKVGLIGEGTYPVVKGGVGTWCDQLVGGLSDHEFVVVTLVGDERKLRWELPENVTSVTLAPMWDPLPRAPLSGRRSESKRVRSLLLELWRAALPVGEQTPVEINRAIAVLRDLAASGQHEISATLARASSAEAVITAWSEYRLTHASLPPMTLSDAAQVAHLADRSLAVLDVDWPEVDVMHVSTNGPSSLIGLARFWRDGTPLILTEHGVYLRERYLALFDMDLPWVTRAALGAMLSLISRVTYAEAQVLAPVSEFNARWERELGADDARVKPLFNGVDIDAYSLVRGEPTVPTVSFVGRIDPLKDLHNLLEAFSIVKFSIPDAQLRIFGPVPDQNRAYMQSLTELVEKRNLGAAVHFEGPAPNARVAAEAGHVVALSSISEGLPFTVIESMMCGRPTVSTDVGGVSEVVGRDGLAGVIVPPRDPVALATELVALLKDKELRDQMGLHARERALTRFSLSDFYQNVRDLYSTSIEYQQAVRDAQGKDNRTRDDLQKSSEYPTDEVIHPDQKRIAAGAGARLGRNKKYRH